jgi:hypothetical protein
MNKKVLKNTRSRGVKKLDLVDTSIAGVWQILKTPSIPVYQYLKHE